MSAKGRLLNKAIGSGLKAKAFSGSYRLAGKPKGVVSTVVGEALRNVKEVGIKGGEYGWAAAKGAMINAGIQGGTEWAEGGSFWSGAKSGLVSGAALGAGYRGVKIGAMGQSWKSGAGAATIGQVYNGYSSAVSKQVKAIKNNAANAKKAKNALGLGGV